LIFFAIQSNMKIGIALLLTLLAFTRGEELRGSMKEVRSDKL